MNRAILIVICDFLVSAMLTMMTGMVPGHTGGTGVGLDESTTKVLLGELERQNTELEALRAKLREAVARTGLTAEREARLRELADRIAANRVQREKLLASLSATPDNTGELNARELQRRLEEEQRRRHRLEIELRDDRKDLAVSRDKLDSVTGQLREARRDQAVQRRELARARESLAKTSEALVDVTRQNARARADLARAEEKLESEKRENRRHGRELGQAREELRRLNTSLIKSKNETGALQTRNANLSGQLVVREQNNAELRDKLAATERQLAVTALQRAEAVAQRDEMRTTVKGVVTELAAKDRELQAARKESYRASARLEAAQKLVAESRSRKNEVIRRYGEAVVRIDCRVVESALFGDRSGRSSSFYPAVDFNGRVLLVGALNRFAGDWEVALSFKDVTEVEFTAGSPGGELRRKLAGPMLLYPDEPRVAALRGEGLKCTPLKLLTVPALINRGLEDLYLFKCTSFGGSSARLDGRVSLSADRGRRTLFVRNAGRANNELKAEPGDFILSAAGEYVGMVTAAAEVDKVRGARVTLFENAGGWEKPAAVQLEKLPGEKYHSRFASAMRDIRRTVRPGYVRR